MRSGITRFNPLTNSEKVWMSDGDDGDVSKSLGALDEVGQGVKLQSQRSGRFSVSSALKGICDDGSLSRRLSRVQSRVPDTHLTLSSWRENRPVLPRSIQSIGQTQPRQFPYNGCDFSVSNQLALRLLGVIDAYRVWQVLGKGQLL